MTELVFLVEEDIDGGLTARAIGEGIFTEADDIEQLRENIRDAVLCHFEDAKTRPRMIRLHVTRDEVLSL
jgi:hypothetical protein